MYRASNVQEDADTPSDTTWLMDWLWFMLIWLCMLVAVCTVCDVVRAALSKVLVGLRVVGVLLGSLLKPYPDDSLLSHHRSWLLWNRVHDAREKYGSLRGMYLMIGIAIKHKQEIKCQNQHCCQTHRHYSPLVLKRQQKKCDEDTTRDSKMSTSIPTTTIQNTAPGPASKAV